MEQVAFISIRQRGSNFGKPISSEVVMKEHLYSEIVEMHENDAIRFYSEEGDALGSKESLAFLEEFHLSKAFMQCKSKEDYAKFIEEFGTSTEVGKTAMTRIEEIIFSEAKSEGDYQKFLMRFPSSPLAAKAKEKCSSTNLKKRILVVSSLAMIHVNDSLMQNLQEKDYTSVSTAVFSDPSSFEDHVMRHDVVLVVVDDKKYADILSIFAYCIELRKEMVLVYEHGLELKKMTMTDVDSALVHLQTNSPSEQFSDLVRDIRLNVPDFVKKMSSLKRLKTNKMETLALCLN